MELQAITGTLSPIREELPPSDTNADVSKSDAPEKKAQDVPPVVLDKSLQTTADKDDVQITTELTDEEKKIVQELKTQDAEVRQHERAHLAAAGSAASGGASFDYVTGPDGQRYATGGEVQLDTGAVPGDPEATIRKAQQIRRAALAPAQPSSQDRRVAASAIRMEMEARIELSRQRAEQARQQASYNQAGIQLTSQPQAQIFTQYT